jgi:type II secretory pathway component PulK
MRPVHRTQPRQRTGAVLLLVLVAITLLSLAAYTFSEGMLVEARAVHGGNQIVQLRAAAQSGIELAAAAIDDPSVEVSFHRQTVSASQHSPVLFSVLAGRGADRAGWVEQALASDSSSRRSVESVFGLANESAKLNLNTLPLEPFRRREARAQLLAIPEMTVAVADALLDWMDPDEEPSAYGAESSFYLSQREPRRPRQGRFQRLDELLLVRGVTEELLYGPRLAGGRQSRFERTQPSDRGWFQYLTVVSGERNVSSNGETRINLNDSNLPRLHEALRQAFDEEAARFVVAIRLVGPVDDDSPPSDEPDIHDQSPEAQAARVKAAEARAAAQLNDVPSEDGEGNSQPQAASVRGLDLAQQPSFTIRSLFDLMGTAAKIEVDGQTTVLTSPWDDEPTQMGRVLSLLEERLTVTDADRIPGRINLFEAPRPVLMSIPGMSDSLADAIVARRSRITRERSVAWLAEQQLLDSLTLRKMAPYLTAGGDVFEGTAVGYSDGMPTAVAIEFLLDATTLPVTVRELREHSLSIPRPD